MRDQIHRKAPLDTQVACHFKGPRGAGTPASPPAEGEILFVAEPRLAETAANAAARPPSEQVWIPSHVCIREDANLEALNRNFVNKREVLSI